ncbi:MAG: NAD(P)H-dependent oxidoreductase [Clostridia bacterium]|nr:NAD(P)H-dependent oxidoreductase [Clostridia bacterium]
MVLFINACARPQSRTLALAKEAVKTISKKCEILNLYEENIKPLDYDNLLLRDEAVRNADFSDTAFRFAKQFSNADEIIIAAPYWDLSFPAILKCYIEAICINGITFVYNEHGIPQSLCKAKRLTFITTAGGFIPDNNYGYNYVKQLCNDFFGIKNTVCIKAEGLDIQGADVTKIIKSAEDEIRRILK